ALPTWCAQRARSPIKSWMWRSMASMRSRASSRVIFLSELPDSAITSTMSLRKVAHEGNQCLDGPGRDGVVQRGTQPAQRPVPLEADQAGLAGLVDKQRIQLRVMHA